jgi:hypothetical protein
MSEHINHNTEQHPLKENHEDHRLTELESKAHEERAEKAKKFSNAEIEHLKNAAEQASVNAKELNIREGESSYQPAQSFVNKEIKEMAYNRLLIRARNQMTSPQKLMSKIIHQQILEDISESTANTVARPSGILGGGIVALIGTSTYYYLTKTYGYSYNYFIFIGLLGLGFIAGWSLEVILKLSRR